MTIRRVSATDLDRIEEIENVSSPHPWTRSAFEAELGHAGSRGWVVDDDGLVRGFAFFRVVGDEAELLLTAVHPDARRRGHGRALLATALDALVAEGVGRVGLEVRARNAAAGDLYAQLGFTRVGLRRRYYADDGDDAVLMDLTLDGRAAP